MKKTFKPILTALLFCAAALLLPEIAQSAPGYVYYYDVSGTRMTRVYSTAVPLKRGELKETTTLVGTYNVTLYPNPTKGILKLKIEGLQAGTKAKLDIIDLSGNTLFKSDIAGGESTIDFSAYPNGTYLMTLVIGDKSESYKVMKVD